MSNFSKTSGLTPKLIRQWWLEAYHDDRPYVNEPQLVGAYAFTPNDPRVDAVIATLHSLSKPRVQ